MSRENTKQIKGLAILLMLAHHLFAYPERMPYDLQLTTGLLLSGVELTVIIGRFCKICVSLFMFLGGYGLHRSIANKTDRQSLETGVPLSSRVVKLYLQYWKVFVIFVPIAFLLFGNFPQRSNMDHYAKYSDFHFSECVLNFLGLSYSFNEEWWFLKSYVFALFLGYVYMEINRNRKAIYEELLQMLIWYLLSSFVFPIIGESEFLIALGKNFWYINLFCLDNYSTLFFLGIVFSKYSVLETWKVNYRIKSSAFLLIISITSLLLMIYVRVFLAQGNLADFLLVPVIILLYLELSEKMSIVKKPLSFLGKYSTNMWLSHSFFCYYFYPFVKIVCVSKNGIVAYVTLLAISLGAAILIEKFWLFVIIQSKKISC